jgi:dephospho-CoA kinase
MPVIGLTGAMGAGKSTVAQVFARHGATVIDADAIGHAILARGGPCYADLVAEFGADIAGADGEIVRRVLAERAFESSEATARLNAIVHPPLVAELRRRVAAADTPGHAVIVDAALLLEWGSPVRLTRLVVVTAPEEEREERVAQRLGVPREEIRRRAQAQMGEREKVLRADIVIVNNADAGALEERAERAWTMLRDELELEERSTQ